MPSVSLLNLSIMSTGLAAGDYFVVGDVSDTTQSAGGSDVRISATNFFGSVPAPIVVTSAGAAALAVGRLGGTTPAFTVDASTASQVAGLKITGAATGGTVAMVVTDSGANANLSINAKGTGTIAVGSVSTGAVTITPATTVTGFLSANGALGTPYIDFATGETVTPAVARMTWNATEGTLDLGLKGGNVTLQVGEEEVAYVLNNTGSDMTDGQVVYVSGSSGQRMTVALAEANAEATSSSVIGILTENIAKNQQGFCTTSGLVHGIDTSALTEGAPVYLSTSVAGGFTSTKPAAPDHMVVLGFCVIKHASNGVIYVNTQIGYELDELHDVKITSAAAYNFLQRNAANTYWENVISPDVAVGGVYKINGNTVLSATTLGSGVTVSSLTSVGTLTNLTVTNTISGSINGNAATATALQTARAINGTNFDGTAGITVPVNNADDTSTNATMYPLWTATAGGNYAAKVSTTKLTFNPSTATLTTTTFSGALSGNASTATALATARAINGTNFDGTGAITVPVNNADDTSTNATMYPLWTATAGGNYAAKVSTTKLSFNPSTGTLTASGFSGPLTGNVTGNVSGSSGSTTGNAATATKLATARNINGVSFDGSADITVTAAAGTLSGTTLASGVTASSLTSVGTLTGLTSSGAVSITNTTQSTSTTTGALVVSGGLGVAKDAFLGGTLSVTGTSTLTGDTSVGAAAANSTLSLVGLGSGSNSGPQFSFIHGTTLESAIGGYSRIIGGTYSANLTFYSNSHDFVWYSGAERMRLDASGNLGLGVTPSAWNADALALQIGAQGALMYRPSLKATVLATNYYYASGSPASDKYIGTGYATYYTQYNGSHLWGIAPSGTAGNAITFTQAMTLDASGNLSVTGTSTLTGNVGIGGASAANVGLYLTSAAMTGDAQIGVDSVPVCSSAATSAGYAVFAALGTAAASFTMTSGYGVYIRDAIKGSGSTITTLYGLYIAAQTAGATNYAIYSAGGQVHLSLPTSSAGLASGSLWNDGGTVKVA